MHPSDMKNLLDLNILLDRLASGGTLLDLNILGLEMRKSVNRFSRDTHYFIRQLRKNILILKLLIQQARLRQEENMKEAGNLQGKIILI